MHINQITAALGCAIVAGLGMTGVASADATDSDGAVAHRIYVEQQPFDLSPAVCGFPVHVSFPVDNEYVVQSSTAPDGTTTQRITGHFVVTFTNENNGNSVTENLSGPATVTLRPDGSLETLDGQGGGWEAFGPTSQQNFGVPGIDIVHGHLLLQVNDSGQATSVSVDGTQTDGCALIS